MKKKERDYIDKINELNNTISELKENVELQYNKIVRLEITLTRYKESNKELLKELNV